MSTLPIVPISKAAEGYALPCGRRVYTMPYKFQQEGIGLLSKRHYCGLFDLPGLGKTLQILYTGCNLLYLDRVDCMVIICRRGHKRAWVDEQIATHAPNIRVHCAIGVPPSLRKKPWPMDCHLYMINYELLGLSLGTKRDRGKVDVIELNDEFLIGADVRNLYNLLRTRNCMLALDESHVIANPKSCTSRVLHALAPLAKRRYISTGTPAAERPDNLWSQIYFLDGGVLLGKDYKRFLSRYAKFSIGTDPDSKPFIRRFMYLDELADRIKRVYIRRTDLSELPEKVIKPPIYVAPYAKQATLLASTRGVMVSTLLTEKAQGNSKVTMSGAFGGAFFRISRAASCPWVVDPSVTKSSKVDDLMDFLEEIGHASIIVWCVNRDVTAAITDYIKKKSNRRPVCISGDVPHSEREKLITKFKSCHFDTLCATMDTLKECETLTVANYAYYLQLNFSLLAWTQTQKRIHRIGQKSTVIIRTAFTEGSLDEYVFNKLVRKEGNCATVMGDLDAGPNIPIDELLKALGYNGPVKEKSKVR